MADIPLTQTPESDSAYATEYVRISRGSAGYAVERCSPSNCRKGVVTLATLCGGNMGKILALTVAQTAAKTGLIDTIYLDGDV